MFPSSFFQGIHQKGSVNNDNQLLGPFLWNLLHQMAQGSLQWLALRPEQHFTQWALGHLVTPGMWGVMPKNTDANL